MNNRKYLKFELGSLVVPGEQASFLLNYGKEMIRTIHTIHTIPCITIFPFCFVL